MMDEWTRNHLNEWTDQIAWEDERVAFVSYVERSAEDDPTITDIGWPSLYSAFLKGAAANAIAGGLA